MKTIFTLLLATVLSSSAFAYNEGRLTVTFAGNTNVQVVIDGRSFHQQDNSILLDNIQPGQHSIQIYRSRANGRYQNNRNSRPSRNDLIYSSSVYVKPNHHVDVMINRFGKALVDERAMNSRMDDDWNGNGNYGNNGNGNYGNGGYGNNGGYGSNRAMDDNQFNQLLQQIRNQWFSKDKMNIAKASMVQNYFNTGQVRQLLQLFSSDSDKLELAKLAYRNTVDQRAYYQLYDLFSFQSSKDELDQYIRSYRY